MAVSYITLSDYANLCSITTEEAKKKLDTEEYRQYIKVKGDSFLISFDIFSIDKEKEQKKEIEEKPLLKTEENKNAKEEILKEDYIEIDSLRKEIEELKQTIAEKDKQINEFALKFAELAQQAQQIAGQAQLLHLTEITESKEDIDKRPIEEAAPARNYTVVEETGKQSIWNRLFRRR